MTVKIARCPEHGLHGERSDCFVCGGPVEQVAMAPVAGTLALADGWMHVGCPRCGRVREWPVDRVDEPVFCTHTDALWFGRGAPHSAWTQVVPVLVMEAVATRVGEDAEPDPCTTGDCENPAGKVVRVEDTGWHAYCEGCAEVLVRGGAELHPMHLDARERDEALLERACVAAARAHRDALEEHRQVMLESGRYRELGPLDREDPKPWEELAPEVQARFVKAERVRVEAVLAVLRGDDVCPTCEGGRIVPGTTGTGAHTELPCPECSDG